MASLGDVFKLCRTLVDKGWGRLLKDSYGLDIDQSDKSSLEGELQRPLTRKKLFPGFEDFVDSDIAGIVPSSPAHSLLYHAFASPNVLTDVEGKMLERFATLAEIETV